MIEIGKLTKGKFGGEARYIAKMDSPQSGVEEKYYSVLRFLEDNQPHGRGYTGDDGHVIKTKDIYTAGETSSYWGSVESRRGAQIDKFQQIMGNVGQMLKALFQLLRELRILEERLSFYEGTQQGSESAEVTLKSVWVDQVEGGAKNVSSVTGLSSQVGFASLPDLFFSVHPKTKEDVDSAVARLKDSHGINRKVREVVGRKLKQYLTWKEKTHTELKVGERFKLLYLKQHYNVIKLYLNWLRPYLRNIKRLQMKDITSDKDVVAAFETSKIELEFLAIKTSYESDTSRGKVKKEFKNIFPCVRVQISFIAIPQMAYQEEFQRGAIHRGRTEVIIEGTTVTPEDLDKYKEALDKEDRELLASVDSSIEAMRDELDIFLKKADKFADMEKRFPNEPEDDMPKQSILEPFTEILSFFKEVTGFSMKQQEKPQKLTKSEKDAAEKQASLDAYLTYYIFKKAHGMVTE